MVFISFFSIILIKFTQNYSYARCLIKTRAAELANVANHTSDTPDKATYENRIKAVLADKKKTNKWLADQLGKDPATISKWCANATQPNLEMLMQIARLLEVQVDDLLRFEELPEITKNDGSLQSAECPRALL